MNRGRVVEERGGKETDRCPLTGMREWDWVVMVVIGRWCCKLVIVVG
jgi:hypothetical protein